MDHSAVTAVITANGTIPYGVGITPNPYATQQKEWERRKANAGLRMLITNKIESLFEPRFITPPETSELIEALITMTESRQILEVGMCTGFCTLHMLRAIVGKDGAKVVSIDARPAHDRKWFEQPEIAKWFEFVEGWTPGIFSQLHGRIFDLVFVDSDHTAEHTSVEIGALWPITKKGTVFLFHDVPEWQSPSNHAPAAVRAWLDTKVADGTFRGLVLPTAEQLDCIDAYGVNYPKELNPHLGVFIRR